MALEGTPVVFHFSSQGQAALGSWFGNRSSFPAFMVGTDTIGASILAPDVKKPSGGEAKPIMLLKWEYVATVTYETAGDAPVPRAPIGFHAGTANLSS
jgi:hypothetical protein